MLPSIPMGIRKFQPPPPPTKSIPLNRSTKKWHNWLRPRWHPYTKFSRNSSIGDSEQMGEIINKNYFYLSTCTVFITFFRWSAYRLQVWSVDGFSLKDVSFWVIKLKFHIKSLFIPQKIVKMWPKMDFFAWKCLTMGMLKSKKLTLIIIVAP